MKFNKMGVFEYSREKGTPSYSMKPQVPKKIMHERYKKLMELQQKISKELNEKFIGKTLPCVIEGVTDDGYIIARSEYDAPEVDGVVYIKTDENLIPGDIVDIKIVSCDEYDLIGEV